MRRNRTFICKNCGTDFMSSKKDAQFCSCHCSNQYKRTQGNADRNKHRRIFQCPHNEAVTCDLAKCGACGWNPTVANNRLRRIAERRRKAMA